MPRKTVTVEEYRQLARRPKRGSKFHNDPRYYEGIRYASKREAEHAKGLDQLRAAGRIRFWLPHPKVPLVPGFVYHPDFEVVGIDGQVWMEEVKGAITQRWRDARRLWEQQGPCLMRVHFKDHEELIKGGAAR